MQVIYEDDVIETTEPYIDAYPPMGELRTVKDIADALTSAVIGSPW